MSETGINGQSQKQGTSNLTIASLVMAIFLFVIGLFCSTYLKTSMSLNNGRIFCGLTITIIVATILLPAPFVLGLLGIITAGENKRFFRKY